MKIVVAPLHEVQAAIRDWRPSHLISLGSPGSTVPDVQGIEHLSLTFHDIVAPRAGLQPVTADQVATLLNFARGWSGGSPLLIHCWAGVSRSPAAAYVIACGIAGPDAAVELARRLRVCAPFATPNTRLVALADEQLGAKGAMRRAIRDIGRGAETSMGATFALDTIS